MRRGERIILLAVLGVVAAGAVRTVLVRPAARDREIPFYSTASPALAREATDIYRERHCKDCHSLFTLRDVLQSVPAPILDGIGSLRSRDWLYNYLSAPDPQSILPSRLKLQYRMPSYAGTSEHERQVMADYLSSLKVKDWYFEETRRLEHEKLTGDSSLPPAAPATKP